MQKLKLSLLLTFIISSSFDQTQFNHLAIVVNDLEESKAFYTKIFDFKNIEDPTENPMIDWVENDRGQQIHMLQGDMTQIKFTKSFHLSLAVPAMLPLTTKLKELNIAYESWEGESGKMTIRQDGVRQVYVQDPNGYWIEINDDWK